MSARPPDDRRLATERHGSGPRVVLVHGFTQTARSWHRVAHDLQYRHEVVAVDLPDHGRSSDVHAASLDDAAALVGASCGQASYVGYSLGGRVALTLALASPQLVERLVLIGATSGIADPTERAARRRADDALAARLEASASSGPADAFEHFLDEWLGQALFASLDAAAQNRAARRSNTLEGLARSLRTVGTGTQLPSQDRLGTLEMPVLVVAGAADDKFAAIARELVRAIGANAELALVDGASHAVPFEREDEFVEILAAWLSAPTRA